MKLRFYKPEKVLEALKKSLERDEAAAYTLVELVDDEGNVLYELAVGVIEGRRGKYLAFVIKGLPSGRDYIVFTSDIEELIEFCSHLANSRKARDVIAKTREMLEELRQKRRRIETSKVKAETEEEEVETGEEKE